jgi:hypothetical protein
MAIFGEASSTAIAGFILTGVSFLIHFIGFATPYWIYISSGPDRKNKQKQKQSHKQIRLFLFGHEN